MPPPMFDECMATVAPFRTAMFRVLGRGRIEVIAPEQLRQLGAAR